MQPSQTARLMGLASLVIVADLNCLASLLCWISTVYCSHWGHALVRHQPIDTLQGTQFGMCPSWGKIYFLQRRGTSATKLSQHPERDSQGPRLLPSDNHLLGCDDRCVVIATAIFMDRCSCRQKVRRLRLRRRFAGPLTTNTKNLAM